jgi:hypothetical protein
LQIKKAAVNGGNFFVQNIIQIIRAIIPTGIKISPPIIIAQPLPLMIQQNAMKKIVNGGQV